MYVTYDSEAEALAIRLSDESIAKTYMLDERHNVDVDDQGDVVQIEVLFPSMGIEVGRIVDRFHLHEVKSQLFDIADASARLPHPVAF